MSKTSSGGGVGLGTITMIVLVIIKATGTGLFDWSWFAVLSSIIWAPFIIVAVFMLFSAIFVALAGLANKQEKKDNSRWK